MRIVHFIETLNPVDGGPPRVAANLASEQARQGHHVTLLTTFEKADSRAADDSMLPAANESVIVERRNIGAKSLTQRLGRHGRQRLAAALTNTDIVHAHGVWDPMLVTCVDECYRKGIPLTLTPHGMLTRFSLRNKAWKKRLALSTLWRRTLQRVTSLHLLTQSEYDDTRLLKPAIPGVVIPNGVEPEEFSHAETSDLDSILPRHASHRYILYLGRIDHIKGPDLLCGAFAKVAAELPDIDLVIAGPDFGYKVALEREIQLSGLSRRIHLVGPVYGRPKSSLLHKAMCVAHLSRHEGFSITILEALACGVPVVISEECHFPQVAAEGAGIVVPLDAQAGAQALLDLLSDGQALAAAGARARQLVERDFTSKTVASRLVDHYAALGKR